MLKKALFSSLILLGATNTLMADVKCKQEYKDGQKVFKLATGSPGELGLLKELAKDFNKQNNSSMCWVKAGSGKSLKLLKEKKVDIIMVHAPKAEKQAIKDGWAINRTLIGSNEFYIVGPQNDPANIASTTSVAQAYTNIANSKANFISRGDNSGTNKKELRIWRNADIKPNGEWYIITKAFMTASLKKANEVNGYFMTDSSTWVANKKEMKNLKVLFKGDKILVNHYHALAQPKGATKSSELGAKFIDFVASKRGQEIITNFGISKFGEPMYTNAANTK